MELITAYLTGIVALIGLFAIRCPHEDVRIVFVLGIAWPLSILGIAVMMLLYAIGWDLDIAKGTKMFGFRRPTNPNARGFAVTVFGSEVQLYSMRKA